MKKLKFIMMIKLEKSNGLENGDNIVFIQMEIPYGMSIV